MAGGNKVKAISKTSAKIIINMDIALQTLNKYDIHNLNQIIQKLKDRDEENTSQIKHSV